MESACTSTAAQFVRTGIVTYTLASQIWNFSGSNVVDTNGHCLDVQYGNTGYPVTIDYATCNGTMAQSFRFYGMAFQFGKYGQPRDYECMANSGSGKFVLQPLRRVSSSQIFYLTSDNQIRTARMGSARLTGAPHLATSPWRRAFNSQTGIVGQQWLTGGSSYAYLELQNVVYSSGHAGCLDVYSGNDVTSEQLDVYICGSNSSPNYAQFWHLNFLE